MHAPLRVQVQYPTAYLALMEDTNRGIRLPWWDTCKYLRMREHRGPAVSRLHLYWCDVASKHWGDVLLSSQELTSDLWEIWDLGKNS